MLMTRPLMGGGDNMKQDVSKVKRERVSPPSLEQLEEWLEEGLCEATDGCMVEPDGVCPHGKKSWLIVFGMI